MAKLTQKRERVAIGQFLIEGPQSVRELLQHRSDLVRELYATEEAIERHPELFTAASEANIQVEQASISVIAAMSETVHPQGVVAVAQQPDTSIEQLGQTQQSYRLVAIMHEVRDPGNAGAVLRVADAAGADAVIFAGESIDPFHPKVVRSTTGSLFHLPVIIEPSLEHAITTTRAAGLRILAADVHGTDFTHTRADRSLTAPTAWLFGNEARGLTQTDRDLADAVLKIPIYGEAESLNLATAAAVCLYETAFAQRHAFSETNAPESAQHPAD